jgi:hypothetical protein
LKPKVKKLLELFTESEGKWKSEILFQVKLYSEETYSTPLIKLCMCNI